MDKSSSSLKNKRSKKSSKAKASNKSKKSRKYKSKKVRRREVSLSSSNSDDSKSLDTFASSSSDDSHRRKRDRSRPRKDAKGRKRKAQGRSYSRDSSEDSHYAKKRKKVKRKLVHDEVRKKPSKKKKIKIEASVDSMSSRSRNCSTCQDGSTSSDDGQCKSRKGRSERKEKDKRLRGRSRSKKSSRYRARSCSSCSPYSENSYEVTEEKHAGENNSRWLRSVITVRKEAEEYGELCRNETKEEIVDDHDYPCRSNDSNDGGTKRELDHHTSLASEEKLRVEDEEGDMDTDLNFAEHKLRDRDYSGSSNIKAYSAGTSESVKETNETSGANVNDNELELILRQRALENLRKFRGEIQSTAKAILDQKNQIVSQVKQPVTDKHEPVQGKSVVNDAAVGIKFDTRMDGEETNLPVRRRNLIACPRNNERFSNMDKDVSGSAKCRLSCAPEKVIDSDNHSGTVTESTNCNTTYSELTKQTQESLHDSLQTSASHEPSNAKFPVTESDVERNAAKTTQAAIQSTDNNGRDVDVLSVENKSGKLQDESNQSSQFEQKTMTVLRGGEMVQVSYKVYIPNKVPALARRQLKR